MKTKTSNLIFCLAGGFLLLAVGCKKDAAKTTVDYTGQKGTVTDVDGNVYQTIGIGTQVWMAENLKTTKFSDGTPIPLVTSPYEWGIETPHYCWYNNDEAAYKNTYGALYNWYAVNTGKLAPAGWHVPSDEEWRVLMQFAGGFNSASDKLREADTIHWQSPNTGATDATGFRALPGGGRFDVGQFFSLRSAGFWWSSEEWMSGTIFAYRWKLTTTSIESYADYKPYGFSVRCVRN